MICRCRLRHRLRSFLMYLASSSTNKRHYSLDRGRCRGNQHSIWMIYLIRQGGRAIAKSTTATTFIIHALLRHHSMICRCRLRHRLRAQLKVCATAVAVALAVAVAGNATLIVDQSLIVANYLYGRNCKTDTKPTKKESFNWGN